jgi:hypothetical protein
MVSAMRTPSSSNSYETSNASTIKRQDRLTDIDGLDLNAFLEMRSLWAVANFMRQDLGFTESVHKSGATSTRGAYMTREGEQEETLPTPAPF